VIGIGIPRITIWPGIHPMQAGTRARCRLCSPCSPQPASGDKLPWCARCNASRALRSTRSTRTGDQIRCSTAFGASADQHPPHSFRPSARLSIVPFLASPVRGLATRAGSLRRWRGFFGMGEERNVAGFRIRQPNAPSTAAENRSRRAGPARMLLHISFPFDPSSPMGRLVRGRLGGAAVVPGPCFAIESKCSAPITQTRSRPEATFDSLSTSPGLPVARAVATTRFDFGWHGLRRPGEERKR
jgi:hypothetical protein